MAAGRLPKPLRRMAALALVALALGLAAIAAFAPFVRMAAVSDELAATAELIGQQERLLRAMGERPVHAARNLLLTGETTGMAGAELQRAISDLARQNGVSLRSTHVTPPKREDDFTIIGVNVGLQGQMDGLRSFLHAIETGVPILFIDTLSIRSVPTYQATEQPVSLDVTLRVRGYGAGKDAN